MICTRTAPGTFSHFWEKVLTCDKAVFSHAAKSGGHFLCTSGCFKGSDFKSDPCSKPYLTIRLKPIIVVVSFYKDLNQAHFT